MLLSVALYKGPATPWVHQLAHRLICWWTDGPYSHVEMIDAEGYGWSSSFRDGGVRRKSIAFGNGHWDVINIEGDYDRAIAWFKEHEGDPYGWLAMILAFLLPWRVSDSRSRFCSKALAEALDMPDPWRVRPNDFQPNAKGK